MFPYSYIAMVVMVVLHLPTAASLRVQLSVRQQYQEVPLSLAVVRHGLLVE